MWAATSPAVRSVWFQTKAPGLAPISLDCGTATTQPASAADDQCATVSAIVLLFPCSATSSGYSVPGAAFRGMTTVSSGRAAAESSSYLLADRSVRSRKSEDPRRGASRLFSSSHERL